LGYAIGALFYDTIGQWLIGLYGYADKMESLRAFYAQWGALFILVKGFTPIPYKLVTIVSGLLAYNFPLFLFLSLITRGARFFVLAAAINHFGEPIREKLESHFGLFIGVLALIVVAGFALAAKMF
jgi:membrane protein YqaA with SNARE-associated domain